MSSNKVAVLLISSYGGNLVQDKHIKKVDDWCKIKKLKTVVVDGADPEQRDLRTKLWEVAGTRGYPLLFGQEGDDYTFIGDYDALEGLIEMETWDETFADFEKTE